METLHLKTPLIESRPLSLLMHATVLLKMETFQPVGSFKIRGIGHACRQAVQEGAGRLVASSGGNAGYAVAYAGRKLEVPVTVVVPETTPEWTRDIIRREGATVVEHGRAWDDAHAFASEMAGEKKTAYIPPFDDPRIWDGHATLIREIAASGPKPEAIVVAVGGGGLLCGVLQGLHEADWTDVPILAVETEGAASLAASVAAGRLVTLPRISSIATTLGARRVAAEALAWTARHPVIPWTVRDRAALDACFRFADDHRMLVEPACGAGLSTLYDKAAPLEGKSPVLVIICGGAGVSLSLLREWDKKVPKGNTLAF